MMASEFYTRVGLGKFELHFQTDNPDSYRTMKNVARLFVDGKEHTNADKIRAMSDEELAASNYIPCPYDDYGYGECKYGWHDREQTCEECKLEWLKRPVER